VKGHADLDHVRPGLRQRVDDRERGGGIGVAGHQEGDEGRSALPLQLGEARVDAGGHGATPAVQYPERPLTRLLRRPLPAGKR